MDKTTICLHIHDAFDAVPYPGDAQIVLDNGPDDLEAAKLKERFKGFHWREISIEILQEMHSGVAFFSPQGYQFYLPAFMIFAVSDFDRGGAICDELVRTLTLPHPRDIEKIKSIARLRPESFPIPAPAWHEVIETLSTASNAGDFERTFFSRVAGFDLAQRSCIREFLEYVRDASGDEYLSRDAEIAIERYWNRF